MGVRIFYFNSGQLCIISKFLAAVFFQHESHFPISEQKSSLQYKLKGMVLLNLGKYKTDKYLCSFGFPQICLTSVLCGSEVDLWGKIPSCQLLEAYGVITQKTPEHIRRRLTLSVWFFIYKGPLGHGTLRIEVGAVAYLFHSPMWSYASYWIYS